MKSIGINLYTYLARKSFSCFTLFEGVFRRRVENFRMKTKVRAPSNQFSCRGFTLLELLVVIAIISILASILLPALRNARDKAIEVSCSGKEKQLSLAMAEYCNENDDWLTVFYQTQSDGQVQKWYSLLNVYVQPSLPPTQYNLSRMLFCPAIQWGKMPGYGSNLGTAFGYGLNYKVVPDNTPLRGGRKLMEIAKPASTILIGDNSVSIKPNVAPNFSQRAALYIPVISPSGLGMTDYEANINKHNKAKNLIWVDGHVSREFLDIMQSKYSSGEWWTYDQ